MRVPGVLYSPAGRRRSGRSNANSLRRSLSAGGPDGGDALGTTVMLQDILASAQAFYEAGRKAGSSHIWFRGHRQHDWSLVSTAHRFLNRLTEGIAHPMVSVRKREMFRGEVRAVYRRFQAEAWPLLTPIERSDWGVLLTMQHYGLPTRFLDWTESFACALFFAQQGRRSEDTATVWMLDADRFNLVALGEQNVVALDEDVTPGHPPHLERWHPKHVPPQDDIPTIAVAPLFTNPRMTAQRSKFVLSGDSFVPLDQQYDGRLIADGILARIDLSPNRFQEVEDYLRLNGLKAYTYFPDLDGLAQTHAARVEEFVADVRRYLPNISRKQGQ